MLYKHMNAALEVRPHAAGQGKSGIETAVAAPLYSLLPAGPESWLVYKQVCSTWAHLRQGRLGNEIALAAQRTWQMALVGELLCWCSHAQRGITVDTGLDNGQHSQKGTRQQIQAWLKQSTLQRQTCLCIYMIDAPAPQPMSRQALGDAGFFSQGLACKSKQYQSESLGTTALHMPPESGAHLKPLIAADDHRVGRQALDGALNDLVNHLGVAVGFLQLGCIDPDGRTGWHSQTRAVEHLARIVICLQAGQSQPQLYVLQRGRDKRSA